MLGRATKSARILIVDDHAANVALLCDILEQGGYEHVFSTTDSQKVIPLYHEVRPDLVLLDLAMPGMNGFELLEALRPLIAAQGYLPVLVLTADITRQAKERALRSGAKDFLTKPFDVSEVLLRIGNLIETRFLHVTLREQAQALEARVRERTRALEDEVNERRVAELALRESEARHRQLIEATFDLVQSVDEDGSFLFVNRAWMETLGYSFEEVCRMRVWDIIHPDAQPAHRSVYAELLKDGAQREVRTLFVGKDGSVHTVEGNLMPAEMRDGLRCVHAFYRDVTARIREEQTRREKERAEASSSAKSELLANMSHELRTPLNSIIGFGRVLRDESYGPLNERQGAYVRQIVRAGEHMLGLVNDLLDLRRLEENRAVMDLRPVSVRSAVEDAQVMVAGLLRDRGHTLMLQIDEAADLAIADDGALVQVVVNLLSNAAKFTDPSGSIAVRTRREEGRVRVEVEDSGIGIAPEDQARIFDYFTQIGGKHQLTMKGSGIGLALTKKLVEAMGGSIGLQSAPGEGSTFWITLPSPAPASPTVNGGE